MRALSTLPRYIAMRFVVMIMSAFLLCFALIFLIDFIELLRQSGKFGGTSIWLLAWMTLLRLPAYSELTLPFAVLVGTIGAFLTLSRSSELVIIRGAGVSVWQFAIPGMVVAILIGILSVTVYNPIAANARAISEALRAEAFGRSQSILKTKAGSWLRQDGVDGQSIIHAASAADHGLQLSKVSFIVYDKQQKFAERIDAKTARLREGFWDVRDAWVNRHGRDPEFYRHYQISTHLTPTQVKNALGSVISISFWRLPAFIDLAEKAALPATRYRIQYEQLFARPILLAVMVLLGATVSLRAFRFGGIQTMVIVGLIAGFGFFICAEMSRQIGVAGLVVPVIAIWVPVGVAGLLSVTALLHQEDG